MHFIRLSLYLKIVDTCIIFKTTFNFTYLLFYGSILVTCNFINYICNTLNDKMLWKLHCDNTLSKKKLHVSWNTYFLSICLFLFKLKIEFFLLWFIIFVGWCCGPWNDACCRLCARAESERPWRLRTFGERKPGRKLLQC